MKHNIPEKKEKNQIRIHFNRASKTYDHHADIQNHAGNKLISLLSDHDIRTKTSIDLGCGSGKTTKNLLSRYPAEKFFAIDIAEKLLKNAKKTLADFSVQYHTDDFESFHYENTMFDFVFSNMALQWSARLSHVFHTIHNNLNQKGILAFSLPVGKTLNELHSFSKNKFYEISQIRDLLNEAEFEVLSHQLEPVTFSFDSWIAALKSIKAVGANCVLQKTHHALRGKTYLNLLVDALSTANAAISLTYEIGYFVARKR